MRGCGVNSDRFRRLLLCVGVTFVRGCYFCAWVWGKM